MKEIMCFGDSNTYGVNPNNEKRWGYEERWPMKLQKLLGCKNYHIIEEGYNGRTTCFEDPFDKLRDGKIGMQMALNSHHPLDMILIMLGTNDSKCHFATTAKGIVRGYELLINMVKTIEYSSDFPMPKIVLVSPIHIGHDLTKCPFSNFTEASRTKILQLPKLLKELAENQDALFFDASLVAQPGIDQIHLDLQSGEALAIALGDLITQYYQK